MAPPRLASLLTKEHDPKSTVIRSWDASRWTEPPVETAALELTKWHEENSTPVVTASMTAEPPVRAARLLVKRQRAMRRARCTKIGITVPWRMLSAPAWVPLQLLNTVSDSSKERIIPRCSPPPEAPTTNRDREKGNRGKITKTKVSRWKGGANETIRPCMRGGCGWPLTCERVFEHVSLHDDSGRRMSLLKTDELADGDASAVAARAHAVAVELVVQECHLRRALRHGRERVHCHRTADSQHVA